MIQLTIYRSPFFCFTKWVKLWCCPMNEQWTITIQRRLDRMLIQRRPRRPDYRRPDYCGCNKSSLSCRWLSENFLFRKMQLLKRHSSLLSEGHSSGSACRILNIDQSQYWEWKKNMETLKKWSPKAFIICPGRSSCLDPISHDLLKFVFECREQGMMLNSRLNEKVSSFFLSPFRFFVLVVVVVVFNASSGTESINDAKQQPKFWWWRFFFSLLSESE